MKYVSTVEAGDNSHILHYEAEKAKDLKQLNFFLCSDIHFDNPKCDRKKLKKDLDEAKRQNAKVLINGDFFCLMQGKGDRRSNKSDIRPEHNNAHYFDSVIDEAVEWWSPYADIVEVIGYGNHETGIIKYHEFDPLKRFVQRLNAENPNASKVYTGGYGGWVTIRVSYNQKKWTRSYKIKYFHGSGGGGVVTRGQINITRLMAMVQGADMLWIGHIHEDGQYSVVSETINKMGRIKQNKIDAIITPAYKEEYENGGKGWHVERGAPPKPIGGRMFNLIPEASSKDFLLKSKTYSTCE